MDRIEAIKAEYEPYNAMRAFEVGYDGYMAGNWMEAEYEGVDGQAYDRGMEAAMRVKRGD